MLEVFIVAFSILANAVLSGLEMAFVTVSKAHLKKLASQGSSSAARVLKLKSNPERTLSVLQVGITLVGAISAAVTGASAEENLSPWLMSYFGITERLAESLSILAVVIPLTYVSVVIGELVPKSVALRFPVKIALWGGLLLMIMDRAFAPFVVIFEYSTKFITRLLFAKISTKDNVDTTQEVDLDSLGETHKQYIFNLIGIDKRKVKDIMVPWDQVTTIQIDDHAHDVLQKIRTQMFTRLPVVGEDKIQGILYTKDFTAEPEMTLLDWTKLIRKAEFLSPNEPVINALKKLQTRKSHMGIVRSGENILGIVTLEDIFEEFVGEIYDESDETQTLLSSTSKIRTQNFRK
ncbi:HlyC/CorC family transporter [Bdellovibrio sp. qaytius]|nr:HlyC/CorC family transporter [Bdellovibrio sp. qaytius]